MLQAVPPKDRIVLERHPGVVEVIAWAAIGSLLSVLITGFVLGSSNNLFHLPIVAGLFDEPQYKDDAFIQSLRYFASGVWLLLRGSEKYIDPFWLFLGLHILTRFVAFLGFLACASLIGIRSRADIVIFILLLSACSLSRGASYAGAGGLFTNIFTHSELANGLTLIALYLMARGRIAASFAMNGVVFFVNAFVAVWNAIPFAVMIADGVRRRELKLSRSLIEGAIGLAVFALIAIPVMLNILANPDFGKPVGFDYVGFLYGYYPNHFLAASTPPLHFFAAALVVAGGWLSFHILGKAARPFQLMLAGYVLVYLIGVMVPLMTHSATILNLHFLRVSTFFHLLAALGVVAVITKWLQSVDTVRARLLAPTLIVVACTVRHGGLFVPFVLLAFFETAGAKSVLAKLVERLKYLRAILLAIAALALAYTVSSTWKENRSLTAWISEWTTVGEWARMNTPDTAVFMVPTIDLIANGRNKTPLAEVAEVGSSTFEITSHRRIWVDFRRGAAVMWSASYYDEWRGRVDEQVKLHTLDERIDLARRSGVSYVVDLCASDNEAHAVKRTARLCVFAVQ
jgi:hypothetical protein